MGLEELKREILDQAEAEAKRLLAAARAEAATLRKQAEADATTRKRVVEEETRQLLETMRARANSAGSLEEKRALMESRKAVMDQVFVKAEERYAALPAAERKKMIEALVKKAKSEIDVAHVYCNPKDVAYVAGIPTTGADIVGGIIAENAQKTLRVDLSFESLIEEIRERHLQEIAAIVFKER